MREAILAVSFGTTVDQARSRDLEGVEQALSAAAPELPLFRAYTSGLVRARLGDRGIAVPDVAGALEQMAAEGIECPLIVPTHLLPGAEYDKIRKTAARWEGRFPALRLSRPLLGTPEDLRELGGALMDLIPPAEGAQTLFMGHGTHRSADLVYPALQGIFHLAGRDDLVVATVEGRPRVEEVLPLVTAPAALCPSITAVVGVSLTISGLALGSMAPFRTWVKYISTRTTPWLGIPRISAEISCLEMARASSGANP